MKKLRDKIMLSALNRSSYVLVLIALIISCGCSKKKALTEVTHYGVLREIMMEQQLEANADLNDFRDIPDLYALGALEGLAGEILILDSEPLNGLASAGQLIFDRTFDRKATLLVSAQVSSWQELPLVLESVDLAELQTIVRDAAKQLSINIQEPFPFLLKGTFKQLDWHVINAAEAESQNHDAYKKAGLSGSSENVEGQLLGFYSEKHEGVFTHHGSFLHTHFINDAATEIGHVDGLKIEGSIVLLLPDLKK